MLKINEAIIVEGKYDKQKLSEFIDATIITTSGFRIFKDKEKQVLIRRLAKERGLVIMTDSDSAGLVIRNFLKGIVPSDRIKNCYIPRIEGKEKRKTAPSKEGVLGVEGLSSDVLQSALQNAGISVLQGSGTVNTTPITKSDLFEMGLSGRENSALLRKKLMQELNLPTYLSSNAFLEVVNSLYTKQEILDKLSFM